MSDDRTSDQLEAFPHPREATSLIGHSETEAQFLSSYNSGRFHHAWLITGLKGIGKATFAYRAARFLLTQGGDGGGLFGPPDSLDVPVEHPANALIQAGSHPGLTVLKREYDPKGKKFFKVIRIDDVRSLSNFFGLKSSNGGWRVVIVDTVDDMNVSAANAFLKILEEPPAKTVFFLLSHTPAGLLPTIRSRCRQLPMTPLSPPELLQVTQPWAGDISAEQMSILAALAEGSPGKALLLKQSGGLEAFLAILDLFGGYPNFDPGKLHGLADTAGKKDGEGLYRILTELFPWWLSRLARSASTNYAEDTLLEGEKEIMMKLAGHHPVAFWVDIWEKANHLINRAENINLDRKQVILNLFLNTAR